jgi:TPR repeat protein
MADADEFKMELQEVAEAFATKPKHQESNNNNNNISKWDDESRDIDTRYMMADIRIQPLKINPLTLIKVDETSPTAGRDHYKNALKYANQCIFEEAYEHLLKSTNHKYPPAYMRLFLIHKDNDYVGTRKPQEYRQWHKLFLKNINWFLLQTESSDPDTLVDIATMYYYGYGVIKDQELTKTLCNNAIKLDNKCARAYLILGHYYDTTKQYELALENYEKGSNLDNVKSTYNLGIYYEHGWGVNDDEKKIKIDQVKAKHYYFLSLAQSNYKSGRAMDYCGDVYNNALGIGKDFQKAAHYYQQSANKYCLYGMGDLAYLYYLNGDERLASQKFELAADQGNPVSQLNIGRGYLYGYWGLTKNITKAKKYLILAAHQGNEEAKKLLTNLTIVLKPSKSEVAKILKDNHYDLDYLMVDSEIPASIVELETNKLLPRSKSVVACTCTLL